MTTNSIPSTPSKNTLSELPIRDEAAALAAVGDDRDLARELLSTLLAGLPTELKQMQRLSTAGDWPALADLAHQVRGATRYCGVSALDETMGTLQKAADSADKERARALISRAQEQAQRLLGESRDA